MQKVKDAAARLLRVRHPREYEQGFGNPCLDDDARIVAAFVHNDLPSLEQAAAFGNQCLQDHYENALVEATIHKQVVRYAKAAVIAFGSDTEGEAIEALGKLLADNVYAERPCGECGDGLTMEPCSACGGDGCQIVKPSNPNYCEHGDLEQEPCSLCDGEGYHRNKVPRRGDDPCPDCNGSGTHLTMRTNPAYVARVECRKCRGGR